MLMTAAPPELTISQRLARYIVAERFENIDAAAVARVKHILAHHIGLACRGVAARDADSMRAVEVARELSDGGGRSSVIAYDFKVPLVDAVLANCQMMRSFGLDDVIFSTGVHPGLVTLPVALGIAERHHLSGAKLITAIAVGYELLGKFAQWSWSLDMPRRATMPFGAFGSLATAARLLDFDEEQAATALAYAAHMAMGLAENDAGPISHYYSLVCRNGITGAYLTRAGAWGSPTVIEGRFGFAESFLGSHRLDIDAMIASLGHDYAVMLSAEKRYPGTGLNQVPIEQMRELVTIQGIRADDVIEIIVDFPVERENFGGGHGRPPFNLMTAPSSVAFQFGLLLLDGELRMERYREVDNPEILEVVARTKFRFVSGKSIRYARTEVLTRDGHTFVMEGDEFAFEPHSLEQMIRSGTEQLLGEEKTARCIALVEGLEAVEDVADLMACLTP